MDYSINSAPSEIADGDVLIINKPLHLTSHDVVARVRRKTGIKRVGHAGTLDPLASGVLIVLVGRQATKRQAEFMDHAKQYEAELTFGSTSHTYDAEGPLEQQATGEQLQLLTAEEVKKAIPQFIGEILQRPPMHSAIKSGGEALYKKARRGDITAEDVPPRQITIDAIELLEFIPATAESPPTARLRIDCQKGVYIRSLAHDMGQAVGTGAYLSVLARTAIGEYRIENAVNLEEWLQS